MKYFTAETGKDGADYQGGRDFDRNTRLRKHAKLTIERQKEVKYRKDEGKQQATSTSNEDESW